MNASLTGFTACGLPHPDYGDTIGEQLRLQAAITASLLEYISLDHDDSHPEKRRLLRDVIAVAAERAVSLTLALDGVEISLPAGKGFPSAKGA